MTTPAVSGVVFLDKPKGWTSRKAVNEMVRLFSTSMKKSQRVKAGHAGTLDPLATGMLPILIGEATRFAALGLRAEKSYEVTFDLSFQTDTLDMEGEVLARFDGCPAQQDVAQTVASFRGVYAQTPPVYSAIKVDGMRAHTMARQGEDVKLAPREIEILDIQLLDYSYPLVSLSVRCSKGTYIRALARDIGEKLGLGGCVTMLRRTSTGGWPALVMQSMHAIEAAPLQNLVPVSQWLRDVPAYILSEGDARRFVQGQRIACQSEHEGEVQVSFGEHLLGLGILRRQGDHMVLHPERVLPSAQEVLREVS